MFEIIQKCLSVWQWYDNLIWYMGLGRFFLDPKMKLVLTYGLSLITYLGLFFCLSPVIGRIGGLNKRLGKATKLVDVTLLGLAAYYAAGMGVAYQNNPYPEGSVELKGRYLANHFVPPVHNETSQREVNRINNIRKEITKKGGSTAEFNEIVNDLKDNYQLYENYKLTGFAVNEINKEWGKWTPEREDGELEVLREVNKVCNAREGEKADFTEEEEVEEEIEIEEEVEEEVEVEVEEGKGTKKTVSVTEEADNASGQDQPQINVVVNAPPTNVTVNGDKLTHEERVVEFLVKLMAVVVVVIVLGVIFGYIKVNKKGFIKPSNADNKADNKTQEEAHKEKEKERERANNSNEQNKRNGRGKNGQHGQHELEMGGDSDSESEDSFTGNFPLIGQDAGDNSAMARIGQGERANTVGWHFKKTGGWIKFSRCQEQSNYYYKRGCRVRLKEVIKGNKSYNVVTLGKVSVRACYFSKKELKEITQADMNKKTRIRLWLKIRRICSRDLHKKEIEVKVGNETRVVCDFDCYQSFREVKKALLAVTEAYPPLWQKGDPLNFVLVTKGAKNKTQLPSWPKNDKRSGFLKKAKEDFAKKLANKKAIKKEVKGAASKVAAANKKVSLELWKEGNLDKIKELKKLHKAISPLAPKETKIPDWIMERLLKAFYEQKEIRELFDYKRPTAKDLQNIEKREKINEIMNKLAQEEARKKASKKEELRKKDICKKLSKVAAKAGKKRSSDKLATDLAEASELLTNSLFGGGDEATKLSIDKDGNSTFDKDEEEEELGIGQSGGDVASEQNKEGNKGGNSKMAVAATPDQIKLHGGETTEVEGSYLDLVKKNGSLAIAGGCWVFGKYKQIAFIAVIVGGVAEVTYKGYRWKYPNGPRLPAWGEILLKGQANSALSSVGISLPTETTTTKEVEVASKQVRKKITTTTTTATVTKKQQVDKVNYVTKKKTRVASCNQVSSKNTNKGLFEMYSEVFSAIASDDSATNSSACTLHPYM